jgi:predicted metal-dependent phosphoesterase TrpH
MARLDLHCHSTSSDGRYPAAEVLARALASGLDVLSLTDHDLPPVLPPGLVARPPNVKTGAPEAPLRLIHGVEVTGAHDGREYHLLVYFPGEMPAEFI